ncbi:MAG: DNA polymerase [Patescibacteria group bacterium]
MNQKKQMQKTLLLIDGNALLHRAFHALPELTDPKGRLVNAVYGFSSILLKVLNELKPQFVVATFDMAAPTFRHEEFKEYKAHRIKAPQELYDQLPLIKDVLNGFKIPIFERAGYEADDLIGTISKNSEVKKEKLKVIIATGDLDTLQLVDENTFVYTLRKSIKDTVIYDSKAVMDRYGIEPCQVVDFKGLKGDASDNIPGVPGVGEKTASSLIKEYGSLENLYKKINLEKIQEKLKDRLVENKEMAFFSKKLATIKLNVPLEFNLKKCVWQDYDRNEMEKLFIGLGFNSLLRRLPGSSHNAVLAVQKEQALSGDPEILTTIKKWYQDKIFSQKIYEIEKNLISVIDHMHKTGIKIDGAYLAALSKNIAKKSEVLEKKIFKLSKKSFNIGSPRQLSDILFNDLGIKKVSLRKTPGGVISTAASELEKIKDSNPIIPLILEHRELTKLRTTYTDALPALISPETGRIHTSFNQLGASTGRFSSYNPNLQNIPARTEMGREIRKAFIAEKDFYLVSFDYSQVELRIAASLAQDKKMIGVFESGQDIHKATAAEINNVTADGVTSDMRYQAKALNFGVLYGMSIQGFAESAGVSRDDAKKFIKEYMTDFQGIASYIRNIKEHARQFGFVETLWGRKRFLPNINAGDWRLKQASERMAVNMPIQGTAADIIKMAMVDIYEKLIKGHEDILRMVLQIHDELLFEIKKNKADAYLPLIKDIMEHVIELAVPLKVNVAIGENWKDMEERL